MDMHLTPDDVLMCMGPTGVTYPAAFQSTEGGAAAAELVTGVRPGSRPDRALREAAGEGT